MSENQSCAIYRSKKKDEHYLFVKKKDDFSEVPEAVLKVLGGLEFAMELELVPGKQLARSNSDDVIANLAKQGFHLQTPPPAHEAVEALMTRIGEQAQKE